MSEEWRNDPATEKQKEKLRFFRCTWDEGITKGQASDAIDECVKKFPDWEFMYQNRPATEEQKSLLRSYGKRPLHTLTYARARDIIKECEGGWIPDLSKYVDREMRRKPPKLDDYEDENPQPLPVQSTSGVGWKIFTGFFAIICQILSVVFVAIFAVLVGLLTSGFKSRRRR